MASKLKQCPACEKEVAKSAKVCPNCGKKLKMGFFKKALIFFGILIIIGVAFSPSEEELANKLDQTLSEIVSSQPSNISPTGEIAAIFKLDSKYTDLQRGDKENELRGQIVQWSLPVYEVRRTNNAYRIQTSGDEALFGGTPRVGAFITVYARNDTETKYIESLKTGDIINFKGRISGTTMRNIDVNPAIVIMR